VYGEEYGGLNAFMSNGAIRIELEWCELWVRQTSK
jgi:hypothetical protein